MVERTKEEEQIDENCQQKGEDSSNHVDRQPVQDLRSSIAVDRIIDRR
jgi:hypothetical protein